MSKKARIIIGLITAVVIVGGSLTYYKIQEKQSAEIKIASTKKQEKNSEDRVDKLILGSKAEEYQKLINKYKDVEEDPIEGEKASKEIDEFISNLEKENLNKLDMKIKNFKNLDISKLDDEEKKNIEVKVTEIEQLKISKNYKAALNQIDTLADNTDKLIKASIDKEKKQNEENIKKDSKNKQSDKRKSKDDTKVLDATNGSIKGSDKNEINSNSAANNDKDLNKKSDNTYQSGSVESFIAKSPTAQYTDQIVGVVANGSSAQVYLLEKNNGVWETVLNTDGYVGSQGVGQASESTSRTPKGSYGLGLAFGTGGNPGTRLQYRQITNNSYWISDVNNPNYNTWQEGNYQGHGNEHLADYPTQYQYAIALDYDGGVGGGSAFFLHCSNGNATAGCISVPTGTMLTLMQRIHNGAHIINVNSLSELANY